MWMRVVSMKSWEKRGLRIASLRLLEPPHKSQNSLPTGPRDSTSMNPQPTARHCMKDGPV